jgi:serine/threonine protein kinase
MSLIKARKLGSGAYSKIYLVKDEDGQEHAVKICLKEKGYSFGMSYREADIALRFEHPYIICLEQTVQGNPFGRQCLTSPLDHNHEEMTHDINHLLYELADGNFGDYAETHNIPFSLLLSVLSDVFLALEHMHLSGYLHRDLRADNILFFYEACEECSDCLASSPCKRPYFKAKLSDLGASRLLLKYDRLTPEVNNLFYRAPECIMNRNDYTPGVDVWSLGCMIYFILQKKRVVEAQPNMSNKDYLEHFAKTMPYSFSPSVVRTYKLAKHSVTFSEFFPISAELEENIETVSTIEHVEQLISGMLQVNPSKRLTITQCIDLPVFDIMRDKIQRTREGFPAIEKENPILKVANCIEREWAMASFKALFLKQRGPHKDDWYTHRIFFLAITILDEVLVQLQKTQNLRIIPTDNMGRIFTRRHFNIAYVVCLYFAVKYLSGISSKVISFEKICPTMRYTQQELNYASNFEIKLFADILNQKVYRPSLYDKLLSKRKPTETDEASLFVYYINAHYNNKSLQAAFSHWEKNVRLYAPIDW